MLPNLPASRAVSKRWADLSGVQKSLRLCGEPIPPPQADYTRITSLKVDWGCYEQSQSPLLNDVIIRTLHRSSNCLKRIALEEDEHSLSQLVFPSIVFPKIEYAYLSWIDADLASDLIRYIPNATKLEIEWVREGPSRGKLNMNFDRLTHLTSLSLLCVELGNITNGNKCAISTLEITDDYSESHLNEVWNDSFLKNLQEVKLDEAFFCQDGALNAWSAVPWWLHHRPNMAIKSKLFVYKRYCLNWQFKSRKLFIDSCHFKLTSQTKTIAESAGEFNAFLTNWKNIRPFVLEINPEIKKDQKQILMILIHCSKFFSLSELSEIIAKAI